MDRTPDSSHLMNNKKRIVEAVIHRQKVDDADETKLEEEEEEKKQFIFICLFVFIVRMNTIILLHQSRSLLGHNHN